MAAAGVALALIGVLVGCSHRSSVAGVGSKVISPPAKPEPPRAPEAEPQTPLGLEHAPATETEKRPTLPLATECKPAKDPSVKRLDALNGCTVSFTSVEIDAARSCTKMGCSTENPCCNRCQPGGMSMYTQGVSLVVTRAGRGLRCQAGSSCPEKGDCELDPGYYDVTGVVTRHADGYWQIALERADLRPIPTSVAVPGIDPGRCEAGPSSESTPQAEARCQLRLSCAEGLGVDVECSTPSCSCKAGAWFSYFENDRTGLDGACQNAIPRCLEELKKTAN